MKWLGFIISVLSVLFLFRPFVGQVSRKHQPELLGLSLNELCAGTDSCKPQEIAEQENEEIRIIQGMDSQK